MAGQIGGIGGRLNREHLQGFPPPASKESERSACRVIPFLIWLLMWSVEYVNALAKAEVDGLPLDLRPSFERIVSLIRSLGLARMREPYVKHLDGKLWEMRLRGKDGIARSLYVTAAGSRVIVLRTFVKKSPKAPPREIRLALERAKEVK
jgi:phage-related protein